MLTQGLPGLSLAKAMIEPRGTDRFKQPSWSTRNIQFSDVKRTLLTVALDAPNWGDSGASISLRRRIVFGMY